MGFHDALGVGDIHIPYQWAYADQSAREGATGFVSTDLGKFARQLDNESIWMLIATTPTWASVSSGGVPDISRVVYSAKKATAGTITIGKAVRITGVSGSYVLVELAKADAGGTMPCFGIAAATITDSVAGNVVFLGKLENVDTSAWNVGDVLYVSAATAGEMTTTRPTGTAVVQIAAMVLAKDASTGALGVLGEQPYGLPNVANGKVWRGDASAHPQEVDLSHANLSGVTSDQHHAQLHKASHVSGGGDGFVSTDLLEAIVKRLQESGGPTTLTLGSIADGQYLQRSGASIIGGASGVNFVKSAMAEITSDTSSTSSTWADLLSLPVTTGDGYLLIRASAGFMCSNASGRILGLRLVVDDTPVRAISVPSQSTSLASALAIVSRLAVSAGSHTVKLQWRVTSGYTIYCNPVSNPDESHCSLVAEEVKA